MNANEPRRAYEIDWDGKRTYTARCVCCFLECEATGRTPKMAMHYLGIEGGCTIKHREMSLRARTGRGKA